MTEVRSPRQRGSLCQFVSLQLRPVNGLRLSAISDSIRVGVAERREGGPGRAAPHMLLLLLLFPAAAAVMPALLLLCSVQLTLCAPEYMKQ
jgi:hypothetical protein